MSHPSNRALWAARIIGGGAAAMWLLVIIGSLLTRDELEEGAFVESVGVAVLSVANIVGVGLAFVDRRRGGSWLIVTGAMLCAFALLTAGRNHAFAALSSGGPFLLSGVLFHRSSAGDE